MNTTKVEIATNQVKDAFSDFAPFLLTEGNNLNLFFTGTDGQLNQFSTTDGGISWSELQIPNTKSLASSCVVSFGDQFYWFFVDGSEPGNGRISYFTSPDAVNWSNDKVVFPQAVSTSASPAACVFQGRLYLIYAGRISSGANQNLFSISTGDGQNWDTAINPLPKTINTNHYPTAVATDTNMYILFKGEQGDERLFSSATSNGSVWNSPPTIANPYLSPYAPAAIADGDTVYMSFQAPGADLMLTTGSLDSGKINWSNVSTDTSISTDTQPGITKVGGTVYLAWKAAGTNAPLNLGSISVM